LLAKFTLIVSQFKAMLEASLDHLHCLDICFVAVDTLEKLANPVQVGKTRVGGIDPNKSRMRADVGAILAQAFSPKGFTVSEFASRAGQHRTDRAGVRTARRGLRPEENPREKLVARIASFRHYQPLSQGLKAIAALLVLTERVIQPFLAGVAAPRLGRKPKNWSPIDQHYGTLRL
jgi:hypothetical protein